MSNKKLGYCVGVKFKALDMACWIFLQLGRWSSKLCLPIRVKRPLLSFQLIRQGDILDSVEIMFSMIL